MEGYFFSGQESKLLGLRIGRYTITDNLNEIENIKKVITVDSLDVLRLKCSAKHLNIVNLLYDLNVPFSYAGSILNYRFNCLKNKLPEFKNKAFEVLRYDDTNRNIIKQLIYSAFLNDPLGYYKNPFLKKILSKEQECNSLTEFYLNNYNSEKAWLDCIVKDNKYLGVVSMLINQNGELDSSMAAVHPEYRGQGVFDDLRILRYKYCLEHNIEWSINGVRIENYHSQKSCVKDGMIHVGNDHVFLFTPLLNYKKSR